jgi:hypothetical protein
VANLGISQRSGESFGGGARRFLGLQSDPKIGQILEIQSKIMKPQFGAGIKFVELPADAIFMSIRVERPSEYHNVLRS